MRGFCGFCGFFSTVKHVFVRGLQLRSIRSCHQWYCWWSLRHEHVLSFGRDQDSYAGTSYPCTHLPHVVQVSKGSIKQLIREEGLSSLYRGLSGVLISLGCSNFVYFYTNNLLKVLVKRYTGKFTRRKMVVSDEFYRTKECNNPSKSTHCHSRWCCERSRHLPVVGSQH
jgi:hypothetical protein